MSCHSCNSSPCTCTSCDAADEPLSSALTNFTTAFFGDLQKTCVNGVVQWVLPCDLEQGFANFPRQSGEGLACYFSRYIQAQQTGPVGPEGPQGPAGSQGQPSVSVKAFNEANQSIPDNVATVLDFGSESFDTDFMHELVFLNSRLTVNTAGKYIIQGQVTFDLSSVGGKTIQIRKNGTTVVAAFREPADSTGASSEYRIIQVHDLEEFIAGDYVELLVLQNTGAPLNVIGQSINTWFGMTLHADQGATGPAGANGTNGTNGAAGPAGPAGPSGAAGAFICIQDQKAQNTPGGTFTNGAWRTRDLNTEVADTGGDATLAANQITLTAGTYRIMASAPGGNGLDRHKTRLQNITDGTTTLPGTSEESGSSTTVTRSHIEGRFTIASAKVFEIQHQCQNTIAVAGFGFESNFATEVYTTVILWKE